MKKKSLASAGYETRRILFFGTTNQNLNSLDLLLPAQIDNSVAILWLILIPTWLWWGRQTTAPTLTDLSLDSDRRANPSLFHTRLPLPLVLHSRLRPLHEALHRSIHAQHFPMAQLTGTTKEIYFDWVNTTDRHCRIIFLGSTRNCAPPHLLIPI